MLHHPSLLHLLTTARDRSARIWQADVEQTFPVPSAWVPDVFIFKDRPAAGSSLPAVVRGPQQPAVQVGRNLWSVESRRPAKLRPATDPYA